MENYTEKQIQRTNILSIVPLRGKVAFPDTLTSFEVGREITLKAIDRATASADRLLFICAQRETEKDEITADDIYSVGTVARIKQVTQLPGGTLRILTEGLYRARARSVQFESGYYYAVTDEILSEHGDEVLEEAYFRTAREMVRDVLMADGKIGKDILSQLEACSDPDTYINMTVSAMRVRPGNQAGAFGRRIGHRKAQTVRALSQRRAGNRKDRKENCFRRPPEHRPFAEGLFFARATQSHSYGARGRRQGRRTNTARKFLRRSCPKRWRRSASKSWTGWIKCSPPRPNTR